MILAMLLRRLLRRFRHRSGPSLPTFNGGGLRPGIDLDNSSDLLERMEELS